MQAFNVLSVCGPYGVEYAWATSTDLDAEKPCAWIHDLTPGSVIKAGPDFLSFIVEVEDLCSAVTLRSAALRLLNLLAKPVTLFRAKSDPPDPAGGEENAGESQDIKPLIIIAQGLSGVVVKQAILIGLRKQEYHSVVRRIYRLVFFGCPHRFSQFALWEDLRVRIPSLYFQTSEPVERPLFLKACTIDSAAMVALSTEFITIATAYDIINIYEGNDVAGSEITVGEQSGTLGINSEVSIGFHTRYLSLSHRRESCRTFSLIQKEILKTSTFQSRTAPSFVSAYQVLIRLGGLLHAPERDLLARAPGTFAWMTCDPRYEDWLSDEGVRILHLYGSTGCGKSNMVGYLAGSLRTAKLTQQPIVFKFCFKKAHLARSSLRGFLLDFILQWMFHLPEIYTSNLTGFLPLTYSEEVQLWKTQTLWEIFRQMLLNQQRPRIFCLIDDLEDCQPQLKRFIPSIFAAIDKDQETHPQTPIPAFKLLVTSKACTTRLGFTHFHKCINLEQEGGLMQDRNGIIETGISQLIEKRPVLAPYRESLMKKLCASNITILQANLHFTILEQCIIDSTPKCIKGELNVIPREMDDCYGTILNSVRRRRHYLASRAFSWIFHAIRTLHTKELSTALAINPETGSFDEGDISGDIVSDLRNVVGPLITVIGDQIDFSHCSFRQYIITREKDGKHKARWGSTQFDDDTAAFCCLSYLRTTLRKLIDSKESQVRCTTGGISWIDKPQSEGMSFLNYAVTNWACHYLKFSSVSGELDTGELKTPPKREMSQKCITMLREFLADREVFDLWFQLYCGLQNQTIAQYQPEKAKERTWLMFLAENGHDLDRLLEENAGVGDPKQSAQALALSAHQGHCAAVEKLLSFGNVENDAVMDLTKDIAQRSNVDQVLPVFLQHVLDKGLIDAKSWCSLLCAAIENGHNQAFYLLVDSVDKYDLTGAWENLAPFHLAAAFGDEELMKTLLTKQSRLSLPSLAGLLNPGETAVGIDGNPFHVAARNGHLNIIRLLHPDHASIEATTSQNFTPLQLASMTGHPEVVEFLIQAGANVDASVEKCQSPLFYASGNGRREVVKILLSHNSKVKDYETELGTPLHWAARGGFSECAKLLLKAGADKDCPDNNIISPLVAAVRSGNLEVVKLLIEYKVDLDFQEGYPLYAAIIANNLAAVRELLFAGASIKYTTYHSWSGTALHYACRTQNVDLVKLLLDFVELSDLNKGDSSQDTPITEALRLRHHNMENCAEIIKLLLEAGADVDARGGSGERPLERAFNSYEITKVLLAHSARLDFDPPEWGLSPGGPLWPAVRGGEHLVVSALVAAGARLHDTDQYGRTPLHVACLQEVVSNGNLEVVKALLTKGAEPLTKTTDDKLTALEIAMVNKKLDIVGAMLNSLFPNLGEERYLIHAVKERRENPELVSTILEYGSHDNRKVDVNWRDGSDRTALFYAACLGYKEAVKILLAGGADTSLQDCDGRCARDVVSTPTVQDLIWDHEMGNKHQGEEDLHKSNDPGAGASHDAGKEDQNLPSDSDSKPSQKEPRKPGDKTLDPSTCKQTNHDGTCDSLYNWDYYWCNICSQEISGFAYHCCLCNNDSYLICQDCFENKEQSCPYPGQHTYRKRFYKYPIASYAEFCDWVVDLVAPTPPETASKELPQNDSGQEIEPSEGANTVKEKEEPPPREVPVATPTDQADTGGELAGALPEIITSVDNTAARDQTPEPTSPHVSESRRTRGDWYRAYESDSDLSDSEVVTRPRYRGSAALARRGTGRNL